MVNAPQRGHLNSISLAWPLARSLPQWQHLISSRISLCMMVKSVAPLSKCLYRAFVSPRDNTTGGYLADRGPVFYPWGRGGLEQARRWGRSAPPPLPASTMPKKAATCPETARSIRSFAPYFLSFPAFLLICLRDTSSCTLFV